MRHLMFASILLFAACKQREVSGDPERGKQLIEQYGCPACHVIPGVEGPRGMIGPPLDHIAVRPRIDDKIENTPATMAKWIQNPQSFDTDNTMPALGINDVDARDITAYLFTLK